MNHRDGWQNVDNTCNTHSVFTSYQIYGSLLIMYMWLTYFRTGFIVTASCDGHVKFWKKNEEAGIEFVKHFRSHLGMNHTYFLD